MRDARLVRIDRLPVKAQWTWDEYEYEARSIAEFYKLLYAFSRHAGSIRYRLKMRPHMWEQSKRWRQRAWNHVSLEDVSELGRAPLLRAFTGPQGVAMCWRACELIAEIMEHTYLSNLVGEALRFYMEHGVLLADVHQNNIGKVQREDYTRPPWVITDPGHAVVLNVEGLE